MKIKAIMNENVIKGSMDILIIDAIKQLYNTQIDSLIITCESNKCLGIFTEKDAIRCIATGIPLDKPIKEAMTFNPRTINENSTFTEAKYTMDLYHISHLPVVNDEGTLTGILNLRDVIDDFLEIRTVT